MGESMKKYKINDVMGLMLSEIEKEKQAVNVKLVPELVEDLLKEDSKDTVKFGKENLNLKYHNQEESEKIKETLTENQKRIFPKILSEGVFENDKKEYLNFYDILDIQIKCIKLAKNEKNKNQNLNIWNKHDKTQKER